MPVDQFATAATVDVQHMQTDVLGYYDQSAGSFGSVVLPPDLAAELESIEKIAAGALAGLDIVEVACGIGRWTRKLASFCRTVRAVDLSPAMIDRATRALDGVANVEVGIADAYRLDALSTRFSGAFVAFWLSHVPRQSLSAFFDSLHGVLENGARVVACDNRVLADGLALTRTDAAGNTYQSHTLKRDMPEVLKNFYSNDEIESAIRQSADAVSWHRTDHYSVLAYRIAPRRSRAASRKRAQS